jgi:hypothetical protein
VFGDVMGCFRTPNSATVVVHCTKNLGIFVMANIATVLLHAHAHGVAQLLTAKLEIFYHSMLLFAMLCFVRITKYVFLYHQTQMYL